MDNIVNMGQNDVMSNFTKTDDIMNDTTGDSSGYATNI